MKGTEETTAPKRIVTELGTEKMCLECKEYWPLDDEFWNFQWATSAKGEKLKRYSAACKACYDKRYRPVRLQRKRSAIKSSHEN